MISKEKTLKAHWSEEDDDIEILYPNREERLFILTKIFTYENIKELHKRGYDLKTLKFEIKNKESKNES